MARTTEKPGTPKELPPYDVETLTALPAVGKDGPTLSVEELSARIVEQSAVPVLTPPAEVRDAGAAQAITAWQTGVKVTALWCNASARNAWAAIPGLGWRRVVFGNDSAFLNITALLSQARQNNSTCNIRIEADNLIHEVYVW